MEAPDPPGPGSGASDQAAEGRSLAVAEVDVNAAFRDHYRFVWRVLVTAGVPRSGVDDAVQDVFITVHRRRRDYDGRAPLRHWIYGIARGVGRNHGRKALRKAKREDGLDELGSAAPAIATAAQQEDEVARQQAGRLVATFVETLAPEQREVFTLVHMEGMAVPEIAAMLGAPVNTVYSRLRLARKRFEAMAAAVRHAGEAE